MDYARLSDSQQPTPCGKNGLDKVYPDLSESPDGDTAVEVKKLVGPLVIVFVLFWILSNPGGAGGKVNSLVDSVHTAGTNMVTFMSTVLP